MTCRICRIRLSVAGVGFCIGAAFFAPRAHAQNPSPMTFPEVPLLRGVVRGDGDKAFLVQNPQLILGADVRSVLLSPDSRFLLVVREVRTASPASLLGRREDAPGEATISLWRARTGRSAVLWRRALQPGQSAWFRMNGWMGREGRALATMTLRTPNGTDKPTNTFVHLFLDTVAGTVRESIVPPETNWFPKLSPTLPMAALVGADGASKNRIQFLRADGTISAPITLPGLVFFTRWSEDGKTLRGEHLPKDSKEGDEPQWYAVDPSARTATRIDPPPKNKNGETDYGNEVVAGENLPLQLVIRQMGKGGHGEVWLQAGENEKDALRLTQKGYPVGVLPDLSGAVYRTESGLYFVPLLTVAKDQLPQGKTAQEVQRK